MNKPAIVRLLPIFAALTLTPAHGWAATGASADAADRPLTLEARIYVFRGLDPANAPALSGGMAQPLPDDGHWAVLTSPVTLDLAGEKLVIEGSKFSWQTPAGGASKFSLISSPEAPIAPNTPAKVIIAEKTQYMERQPDGSYRLQEIAADSPGSAHCDLGLSVRLADNPAGDLLVTCTPDVEAIQSRERIPGVDLDVGKPILASFRDTLTFTARPGDWSCLYNRSPGGGDYGLLVLISIAGGAAPAPSEALAPVPSVQVITVVNVVAQGNVPQPAADHPVYYFPSVVCYTDLGALSAGDVTPPPAALEHQLADSLYAHGYRPATQQSPPSVWLEFRWGYIAPTEQMSDRFVMHMLVEGYQRDAVTFMHGFGNYRMGYGDPEWPLLNAARARPRYYLLISAFDYQKRLRHDYSWLWDERVSVAAAGISMPDALATLIASAGAECGRAMAKPLIADHPVVRGESLGRAHVNIEQIDDSTPIYR